MTEKIRIESTKSGLPALWEMGGGFSNTGEATIITNKDGQPKKAVYIRRSGHLANGRHALIPISVGDHIIDVYHHRRDFTVKILRITRFEDNYTIVEQINCYDNGQWDKPVPEFLNAAIVAAKDKATTYHCRSPFYVSE